MADLASPNVGNYAILKGKVFFTPTGGARRSLGNCTQFDIEPTVDTLDHFSAQEGVKSKDFSATISVSATASLTLDEISLKNLQLALFGSAIAADSDATDTTERADTGFEVLGVSSVTGKLEIEGTNDVGPKYNGRFESVTFKPNGPVSFIGDADWATIQLQGDVLKTGGSFGRIDLVA